MSEYIVNLATSQNNKLLLYYGVTELSNICIAKYAIFLLNYTVTELQQVNFATSQNNKLLLYYGVTELSKS